MRAIGLMSGTSLDGVDGVLANLEAQAPDGRIRARRRRTFHRPYPPDLIGALLPLQSRSAASLEVLADLEDALAEAYATAVAELRRPDPDAQVRCIACHGQTAWHRPPQGARPGRSLQRGNAAKLARRTGVAVVSSSAASGP